MTRMMRTSWMASAAFIALLAASPAGAQTDSQRIAQALKSNQRVLVTDAAGHELDGRVDSISDSTLGLIVAGRHVELVVDDIVKIDHPRDGLGNGALIGFGVGAASAVTLLVVSPGCSGVPDCWRPSFPMIAWSAAWAGAAGAGVGAAIDALIGPDNPTIYRRGMWPRTRIAPAIGPGVRGGVVSVTW